MLFTIVDKLKDPCVHTDIDGKFLTTFVIQMPLDSFTISFYDWYTGDDTDYDVMIEKYGFDKTSHRFRCLFTNITSDKDELDLLALLVNSVNIWKTENIAQIELKHLSEWDYSKFFNYINITRMPCNPDLILTYKTNYH